jgi:hypothetical protein
MGRPQRARARDYVEKATRQFRADLAALVSAHERAGNEAREVLGDPAEFATRAVQATAPLPSPWNELVGPFTRSEGVQARLGISRQAVASKATRRRLLRVVSADGVHLYPVWQFSGKSVLNGLPPVLALFPEAAVDGWTVAGWLRTEDVELGESPYDVLVRGDVARVLSVARTAARALSR